MSKQARHLLFRSLLLATLLAPVSLLADARSDPSDALFPEPAALRSAVEFWMRVYLEATTDGGFIHDARHLRVVYEQISFDGEQNARKRERITRARKKHWQGVLARLASGASPRDASERALVANLEVELGRKAERRDYGAARTRVRFQLGQRDKFEQGLARSGAYEQAMQAVFRNRGLPTDLAYLPHVESSFNVEAYSKYGAAGVWQFMRSTGRRFLEINYVVDERLDPMRATHAAAELLSKNYEALGSWPLAITAYNHGRTGMARAKRKMGTDDIAQIVRRYQSRTFGFASRNFYAQFLAARRILGSYTDHFGEIERDAPEALDEVVLPFFADVKDLEQHLGVSRDLIRRYNRDLRKPVFTSGKRIPKGYTLRLPKGTVTTEPSSWLASLPEDARHDEQYRSNYYQVRRGDTLSRIAARHRTRVSTLVALNNLPSRHRIYPGQVIQLPDSNRGRRAESTPRPPAKVAPVIVAKAEILAKAETNPRPLKPAAPPSPEPVPDVEPPAEVAEPAREPETSPPAELLESVVSPSFVAEGDSVDPDEASFAAPAEVAESDVLIAEQEPADASEAPATDVPPSLGQDSPWRRIDGSRVRVDSLETLGHYADWLEIPTQRLRDLNSLRWGRPIHMGQTLKLDFSRVGPDEFLQRRMEYHKGIEEDFFGSYRVTGTLEHSLARGQSLWLLAHKHYGVPPWLIQRYNPDLDLSRLLPGTELRIPTIEPLS